MKRTFFGLVAAAVTALGLTFGAASLANAALLKFDFNITELTRTTDRTQLATFVPITGSFLFDTTTATSFSFASAVDSLQFTLQTPSDPLQVSDFLVNGSNQFPVGPQFTIRNTQSDPGSYLELRFRRSDNSLNSVILQTPQGFFNAIGVPAGRNTVTVTPFVAPPVAPIPLPASALLLLLGLGGLAALRRRARG